MRGVIKPISRLCAGLMLLGAVSYAGGGGCWLRLPGVNRLQVQRLRLRLLSTSVLPLPCWAARSRKRLMRVMSGTCSFLAAKSIWGHGNSSNNAPSPNAGPVPIYYWDLAQ